MKKKIRCYSVNEVMNMRGIKDRDLDKFAETLIEYEVHIFQPFHFKATSGPTRRPGYYITTNENFDRWIQLNNTVAQLKSLPIAKLKYKEYPRNVEVNVFGDII